MLLSSVSERKPVPARAHSRWLARVVALLAVVCLLAACAGAANVPTELPTGHAAGAAAAPVASPIVVASPDGGEVILAQPTAARPRPSGEQTLTLAGSAQGPLTLDPALLRDVESSFLARQIFRGLVSLDDALQPQPELAERIEISADGLRYTFSLRSNAVFHDGSPITAQAVADSLNRACDPALDSAGVGLPAETYLSDIAGAEDRLRGAAPSIAGIGVLDVSTLQLTLAHPSADFLYKLAGAPAEVVDVRSARGANWWRHPNGSGPFTLDAYTPGDTMVLRGFEQFYRGAPALRQVRILGGDDAAQPLNLYEANDIDYTETPFYSIDRVLTPSDPLHAELVVEPQLSTTFLLMNPNIAPFTDRNLRLAIEHAFDRAKEAHVGYEDRVQLAAGLTPPGIGARDWPAELPAYDLAAARQALDAASARDVRPVIYEPGAATAATIKAVLERDLGLEIDAVDVPWEQFSGLLTSRKLPALVLTWVADYPDPENFVGALFDSQSPDNYIGYSNPEVDTLLAQAQGELNADARDALYLQAQQLIINDGVLLPLYHDVSYTLIKPWVHGLTITPIGVLSLEAVWIER
jgi:ABC-type transport system substrate-binding protein